jgi:hypothetical protein
MGGAREDGVVVGSGMDVFRRLRVYHFSSDLYKYELSHLVLRKFIGGLY